MEERRRALARGKKNWDLEIIRPSDAMTSLGNPGTKEFRLSEVERTAENMEPLLGPTCWVAGGLAALLAWLPLGWETLAPEGGIESLERVHDWIFHLLWFLSPLVLLVLIPLTVMVAMGRHSRASIKGFVVTASLVVFTLWSLLQTFPWRLDVTRTSPRGGAHAIWVESLPEGEEGWVTMTRVEEDGWFSRRDRVLATLDPEATASWTYVVRPREGLEDRGWQVWEDGNGLVLGVWGGNQVFLFDVPDPLPYLLVGEGLATSFEEGRERLMDELSPFVLLDGETEPHGQDLALLVQTVLHWAPDSPGHPAREHMEAALTHPHPTVRKAGRELLEMMGPAPEEEQQPSWTAPESEEEVEWEEIGTSAWGRPPEPEPLEPGEGEEGAAQPEEPER